MLCREVAQITIGAKSKGNGGDGWLVQLSKATIGNARKDRHLGCFIARMSTYTAQIRTHFALYSVHSITPKDRP